MNLGFTPGTVDLEVQRLVLHEFGHTLGFIHEHSSPDSGILFKQPEVFTYFAEFGFTAEQVQSQILTRYTNSQISNTTGFDPDSVMLYCFPASIATPATKNNQNLSDGDKKLAAQRYPLAAAAGDSGPTVGIPLVLGVPKNDAFLFMPGPDVYNFEVKEKKKYLMETTGDQAWVMFLFRKSDLSKPIQFDSSGAGERLNARIVADLDPGIYYLNIKHLLPEGEGSYGIVVRPA